MQVGNKAKRKRQCRSDRLESDSYHSDSYTDTAWCLPFAALHGSLQTHLNDDVIKLVRQYGVETLFVLTTTPPLRLLAYKQVTVPDSARLVWSPDEDEDDLYDRRRQTIRWFPLRDTTVLMLAAEPWTSSWDCEFSQWSCPRDGTPPLSSYNGALAVDGAYNLIDLPMHGWTIDQIAVARDSWSLAKLNDLAVVTDAAANSANANRAWMVGCDPSAIYGSRDIISITWDLAQRSGRMERHLDILSSARAQCAATLRGGNQLIVAGGRSERSLLRSVECVSVPPPGRGANGYGLLGCLPDMQMGRRCFTLTAMGDEYLYAVGGNGTHDRVLNSVERYDFASGQWRPVASLCTGRMRHEAVILDGLLCAIAGYDSRSNALGTMEHYNPIQNEWHMMGSLATTVPNTSDASDTLDTGQMSSRLGNVLVRTW